MKKVKTQGRVPLARALSKLGSASRTEAEAWIRDGRVKVHGTVEKNPARMVNPDQAHIELDGKKVEKPRTIILLFHKPKGVVTTKRDPEGRPTIYDHLPHVYSQFHAVGRLDMHTTGLLLLTNDTRVSNFLTDPDNGVEREYVVVVKGEVTEQSISKWEAGVRDRGEFLKTDHAMLMKSSGKESTLKLVLSEGKNREIRRLSNLLGHEVMALKRIRYGVFTLADLEPGACREASPKELNESRLKIRT